jgi:hypothetical protein
MSPRTITLVSLPALLLGLGVMAHATLRIRDLDRRSAALLRAGREAGDSFVETLQGEHATRQLQAYDERRAVTLARAGARRDRLLGLLAAVAGGIGLAAASAFRRIAAEIEEERRHLERDDTLPGPPGGGAGG